MRRIIVSAAMAVLALGASILLFPDPGRADTVTLTPRIFPVGKWADGMVFDGNSVWVAEAGQRTIAQLNSSNAVARRFTVGRLPSKMKMVGDGAIYTLVETDNLLWQQFPTAGNGKKLPGIQGGCPNQLGSSDQFLWVLSTCGERPSQLVRIDPRNGSRATVTLGSGGGTELLVHQGKVWANTQGLISVVDERTMAIQTADIQGKLGIPVNVGPFAESSGKVFIGTQGAGSAHLVLAVDPSTLHEVARQPVDQQIAVMTGDARSVVAISLWGKVFVFSPDRLELQRIITLPIDKIDPRSALILGDDLYVTNNQQQGEYGAVLVLSGWRPEPIAPATPAASSPAPAGPPTPPAPQASTTDCPYQVTNTGDATGIWMYQDPDTTAPQVSPVPSGSKGLVADRCLKDWCHVTFRGASGWVQRTHIQASCN